MNHFKIKRKKIFSLVILCTLLSILSGCFYKKEESEKINNPFKVASIQFNPQLNELDKNVEELLKVTETAFKNGAKLVVAPEMATTGYYYKNRNTIKPFVDSLPGKTTDKFSKLTKKYNAYVIFGMPEVDKTTDLYYNSAALVGPDGYIGKYRKTHQWESEEHWAAWGDLGVPVYDTNLGKIAINICMDSAYFESARLAGVQGANILAFPTNSSAQAISALPARAQQNGFYVVSANRSNTENGFHMIGGSAIWTPEGKKLNEAPILMTKEEDINESTLIYGTIDPRQYNNKNRIALEKRRPELYKDLMLYISPWDYTKNTSPKKIIAASLQYEPKAGNKEYNKNKISQLIKESKKNNNNLNLVVLPELSLIGPTNNLKLDEIKKLSEKTDGDCFSYFSNLAKENNISIIYGMIEIKEEKLYNSAIFIDENGQNIGIYRKTHLNQSDKKWATQGSQLSVFKSETLGKVGILIGEDVMYPEASGVLAINRADIIAIPSAWNGQYGSDMKINKIVSVNKYPKGAMTLWDSTAMSAQAYTIISNFVGTDKNYQGRSSLYTLDPLYGLDQPIVASDKNEEALIFTFETLQNKWWFNQEKLTSSRRTPYYIKLIEK
ncbi:nitrilase-related carbon-nitrogen hydrolase [Fusobacterium sp. MFO224]|uniref:nitrilase-related carbon-nitrogen hydrolase n=1 Tax=Fusobacterium sp. MFO224 TaxID=3378070 RepID=UPI00385236E6